MKLFISTQYKENYGAHSWDGEGECPQYWKFKGGENYVAFLDEGEDVDGAIECLTHLIEYADHGSAEYIIGLEVLEDDADLPHTPEAWEPTVTISRNDNSEFVITKSYLGEAWYGNGDYLGMTQSWVMKPKGKRANYSCHYIRNLRVRRKEYA